MKGSKLETGRLILRQLEPGDAAEIQRRIDDVDIARNTLTIPHPYTLADAEQWLAMQEEKRNDVVFGITLREGGTIAGVIGIVLKPEDDRGEIGYWITREFQGQGLASEAVSAAIDYGFEALGLNRIEAAHFSRNPASGRVMEKCGMRHEGRLRQRHKKWGEYVDCEMYAILRSEWEGGR